MLQKGSGVRSGALPGARSGPPPIAFGAGSTADGVTVGSAASARGRQRVRLRRALHPIEISFSSLQPGPVCCWD